MEIFYGVFLIGLLFLWEIRVKGYDRNVDDEVEIDVFFLMEICFLVISLFVELFVIFML